ncbi:MAG TPA: DUF2332 domain-containing protein [Candidatus Limnocylindrales bacterium]|nr:DUF2332 domain-containing protein [Candidatus Limnocylindrales bacterium]
MNHASDTPTHTREDIANYFRLQAQYCKSLGSPFYGTLIDKIADDIEHGGVIAEILDGYPHEPAASAMALRFMGAIHRRVLSGKAPELARHYPSTGGDGNATAAWSLLRLHALDHKDELRQTVANVGVQTNEVGRAAALICGFLTVARETGLPLRCLEMGASGGLNLRWDHFRYQAGAACWGDPASPVILRDCWIQTPPPFDVEANVVERAGCDLQPIDPTSEEGRLTLLSFAWPDQLDRFRLLDAAIEVARRVPVTVERANGADWIGGKLLDATPGVATVVFHSIVIQYLDHDTRTRFLSNVAAAGRRATTDAPLAWLRMEPGGDQTEVTLTLWPGGKTRKVATAGFHGRDVHYLAA